MIKVVYLADHLEAAPILAQWFRAQWADYYAERTLESVTQDFYSEANRHDLPIRLVAFVGEELAGTIVLREHALGALPEYRPGLGGLFVAESHRRHGVGTELVRAGMNVAREQGFRSVYAGTEAARGLLERLGWEMVETLLYGQEHVAIYRYILET